jgi:hypothetical protein
MMDLPSPDHTFEVNFADSEFKAILHPSSRDTPLTSGSNHGLGGRSLGRQSDGRPAKVRITMLPVSSFGTGAQERPRPRAPQMASPRPQRRASLGSAAPASSAGAPRKVDTIRQSFETTLATNLEYGFTTILPSTCTSGSRSNADGPMQQRRASLKGGISEHRERASATSSPLNRSRKPFSATMEGLQGVFDGFDAPTALRTKGDGSSSHKPQSKSRNGATLSRSSHHSTGKPSTRLSDPSLSRSTHTMISGSSEARTSLRGNRAEGIPSPTAPTPRPSVGASQLHPSSLHASQHSRAGPARRRASMNATASLHSSGSDRRKAAPNADGFGIEPTSAHLPSYYGSTSQPLSSSSHHNGLLSSSSRHNGQVMRRRSSLTGGSDVASGMYQEGPAPAASSPVRTSGPRRIQRRTSIGNRYGVPPAPIDNRPESPSFAEEEEEDEEDGSYKDACMNGPAEIMQVTPALPAAGRTTKKSAGRVAMRRRRLASSATLSSATAAIPAKPGMGEEQSVVSHSTADTQSSSSDHP